MTNRKAGIQIEKARAFGFFALLLGTILHSELFSNIAFADSSNYQRINVGKRVSLEIPRHWYIRDLNERRNISAAGEAIANSIRENEPVFVSALSAVSRPEPVGGIIRVSYIPTKSQDEQLYQKDVALALKTEFAESIRTLNQVFGQEIELMAKGLKNNGIDVLSHGPANLEKINGIFAITYTYRRTSAYGQSPFRVTQYHIPLGIEKVIISLSYRETDAPLFRPILDRVKNSLVIK